MNKRDSKKKESGRNIKRVRYRSLWKRKLENDVMRKKEKGVFERGNSNKAKC